MEEGNSLFALLSDSEEPSRGFYQRISKQTIARPEHLLQLICTDDGANFLLFLTDYGYRVNRIFARIFSENNTREKSFPVHLLSSISSTLITQSLTMLQPIHVELLLSVFSPALSTALNSETRQGRELMTTLVHKDGVVKRLLTHNVATRAIASWAHSSGIHRQNVATLAAWTEKLVTVIQLCPTNHGLLHEELVSSQSPSEAIQTMQSAEIIAFLQVAASTFPCNLCTESLRRGAAIAHGDTAAAPSLAIPIPRFGMEVFGKPIGSWEVLLSSPALSGILDIQHSRPAALVREKLKALANGHGHTAPFAGSALSRQSLKVPLHITQCGCNRFIVWQIDIDMPYGMDTPSQIVRIWDLVRASDIDRLLGHVAVIQSTCTAEIVDRCRLRSQPGTDETNPEVFPNNTSGAGGDFRQQIKLDVRSKDQYFYNLIGKFFPFTESFFQPRDNSYVPQEYPYKLSPHEAEIVCHSDSSSIILGRSGTGKTTCLVFRLIGRYIAGKEFNQDRPLKQILLTRSLNLADKIRGHIRQSLETLLPGSTQGEEPHETNPTLFNPSEALYPYVCTFEELLERLENTIAVVQGSETQEVPSDQSLLCNERDDNDHELVPTETREGCVDFGKFKKDYWEKLARKNDRNLPLSLVFAEIMGVIKGSAASAVSLKALTRDDYLRQSCRIAPTFSAEVDKIALYKLFEVYESYKQECNEVDYVDRVLAILRALQETPVLKQILAAAVDEVYVDEVQDQRSVDLELLLRLIKDGRCFHVAGDTAQAISQESTFRFQDLKAMVHNHFTRGPTSNKKVARGPRMFQLGLNYRSHDGIVKMGSFVMDLLWKTFPETVDKLRPEEGLLPGPVPIFFVGCESDVLTGVNRDESEELAVKTKFGVEQVVLVRDEDSKARLEGSIGDIALILTIRQSKGMEFDDVVLFDFFTSCQEADGWRSLPDVLGSNPKKFDSRRYAAICPELKHLYVAITRARNKLFIIETASQNDLTPIVRLLTKCTPESTIQLISRKDFEFDQNLRLLRPDRSSDPKRWIGRGSTLMSDGHYREALHCFEQADYQQGIKFAQARLKELEGSKCFERNDRVGATEAFGSAIAFLLEVDRIQEAEGICRKMGWLEHAAGLWLERNKYEKAAKLFDDARLYIRAAECYKDAQMYGEAAAVLWKGKAYDQLVRYLIDNRDTIPENVLHTYGARCKIPLRQNKLSGSHRKEVISLLGSSKEREALLWQYEIYDVLEDLYRQERRFNEIFKLRLWKGNLEGALQLLCSKNVADRPVSTEDQVNRLIDYTITSRILDTTRRRKKISPKLLHDLSAAKLRSSSRIQKWRIALDCLGHDNQTTAPQLGSIEDESIRLIVALQILDPLTITNTSSLDVLLTNRFWDALMAVRDIMRQDDARSMPFVLTACGVWKTENPHNPYVILPWSPLSADEFSTSSSRFLSLTKAWTVSRLNDAVTALHNTAQVLWNNTWGSRCARYLIRKYCPREKNGCERPHVSVNPETYSTALKQLLWLNKVFCGLTSLYYRRVMSEQFQRTFLGIRRSWLERLLREITFVSVYDQEVASLEEVRLQLRFDEGLSVVASGIEALILYRLKWEWSEKHRYSALLEQLQLATALGISSRFLQVLSHITRSVDGGAMIWEQIATVRRLEVDVFHPNVSVFNGNIEKLEVLLSRLGIEEFMSCHSVTTTFEYLVTYMILRICSEDFIVPKSWLYFHLPRVCEAAVSGKLYLSSEKRQYQDCLLRLVRLFCVVLRYIDEQSTPISNLRLGNQKYPISLLQQRNAELLAVALLNLRISGAHTGDFLGTAQLVNSTLILPTINQPTLLQDSNLYRYCKQVEKSCARYHGRNPLIVVRQGLADKHHAFPGTVGMRMGEALDLRARLPYARLVPQRSSDRSLEENVQGLAATAEAARKLQSWWRIRYSLQRCLVKSFDAGHIGRFNRLMARCAAGILRFAWRLIFVQTGFNAMRNLSKVQDGCVSARALVISAFDVTDQPSIYDQLDQALATLDDVQSSMTAAGDTISDVSLESMVAKVQPLQMRIRFNDVEAAIQQANERFEAIEAVVEEAHKNVSRS